MAITAKMARYIRLDSKSLEISTLDNGNVHLMTTAVPEELASEDDIQKIEQHLIAHGYSRDAAAEGAREARDFYHLGADCLWISFARGHLWWTFADLQVVSLMNDFAVTDRRVRTSIGGWRNTDANGSPIQLDQLSGAIKSLEQVGTNDPEPGMLRQLLQLINADTSVEASSARPSQVPSKLFRVQDVLATPSAAPDQAGLYAWWFDHLPKADLSKDAIEQDGFRLAYVGIASSREGSPRTLKIRLRNHCNGPIATSTLRRSLAALLMEELNLEAIRAPGEKTKLAGAGEAALTEWLAKHGRVAWIADPKPWLLEDELLKNGPPLVLNIMGNAHPFVPQLKALRRPLADLPLSVA